LPAASRCSSRSQASWSRGRRRASSSLAVSCKAPKPIRPRLFTSARLLAGDTTVIIDICLCACCPEPATLAAIGSRPALVKEEELRLRNSTFSSGLRRRLHARYFTRKQERLSRLTRRKESSLQRIRHGIFFPWPAVPPGQRCFPRLFEQPALST
jgi:hypothetical protein